MFSTHNALALREAQQVLERFEKFYGLSTADMVNCAEGDPRLANIDTFELMDWYYALEQTKARGWAASSVWGIFGCATPRAFPYARTRTRELTNAPEFELDLVA